MQCLAGSSLNERCYMPSMLGGLQLSRWALVRSSAMRDWSYCSTDSKASFKILSRMSLWTDQRKSLAPASIARPQAPQAAP